MRFDVYVQSLMLMLLRMADLFSHSHHRYDVPY